MYTTEVPEGGDKVIMLDGMEGEVDDTTDITFNSNEWTVDVRFEAGDDASVTVEWDSKNKRWKEV